MVQGLTRGWLRTGVAATAAGMLLTLAAPPATQAAPTDELIWEEGTVTHVADGDTLVATLDAGPGLRGSERVRTIGVQAPETGECGSAQAEARLRAQLPIGSRVQTRSLDVTSNDDHSGGRILRSLYARDQEDNWYDTSRQTVSDGWLMWFPKTADSVNKAEYAHNLEYRVLADDAASQRRGLWSANLCGTSPYPGADLRVWAKYWGTEEVYVENRSAFDVNLSGWTIRDSALNYRTLPAGTVVPAGSVRRVYSGSMGLNNLPTDNAAFEGDAVFLMDTAGPHRTGNLRAWFAWPCNPDECGDVLTGKVTMALDQVVDPPATRPSAPGSVKAVAATDGSGQVSVSWAAPINLGAYSVTYTLTTTAVDGGTAPAAISGITGLSRTVTGLTLGRAYTFSVTARNSAGESAASQQTPAVSPGGLPGAPSAPTIEPRATAAIVSWAAPAGLAGEPPVRYTVTATPAPTTDPALGAVPGSCQTTAGETSCRLVDLVEQVSYAVTVTAVLGTQSRVSGATSYLVPVAPVGDPGEPVEPPAPAPAAPAPPTAVQALAGDGRAVVSWAAPDQAASGPIERYDVAVTPAGGGDPATCSTDGTTSCVVSGLANGTSYTATVSATVGTETSPASAPSAAFTPYQRQTRTTGGPTAAPPAADPWIGGEIVTITNRSSDAVRLGGYGLWDRYSADEASNDSARYLFPADQALAAGQSLRVHFGTPPSPKPAAPAGSTWLWTGTDTFINADAAGDFVELAHLNRAQVTCATTGAATCRGTKQLSISSAPVGLTALSSASSVTVNWGAPISRGGTPITGYTATAFDAPIGGTVIGGCKAAGGARSCSFPATLGRAHFVEVVAHNSQGTSGPSWRVRAVPKTVPGAPAGVRATAAAGGVAVQWSAAAPNGAPVTSYTAAAYTAATGGSAVSSCTASGGALGCVLSGLDLGTRYFIDVRATNRAGAGAPSSPRVGTSALGAQGAVSTWSKGRVTVRWDRTDPAFATVTGYIARLYTKKSGGSLVGSCTATAGATSCRTKKMKKRSTYFIDLTTTLAVGSYTTKPRIVTGPPKKATRPTVTSVGTNGRRAVIAWAPPTFHGYSYLKGYAARVYSKSKGGKVKASCSAGPNVRTCTTKALKKGTYWSTVRVKNSKGWSSWSKRVKVVIR